jgi:peptidyl-prolyl cis-trans isomerase C
MKSFLRAPLLHFLVLGGVLFAIDAARSKPASPAPPPVTGSASAPTGPIVVDAEVTQRMTAVAQRRLGRPPTPPEIDAEIQRFIDEEILFREALARGLERDDPMIHERIASRMSYVLAEAAVIPEPTDAQLRAWFDAHADRYNAPERLDFTHVFIANPDDTKRVDALAAQLAAGTAPETLGDTFSGGRKYRGRKRADLAESFGAEFAVDLDKQPLGTWVRRSSRHGVHLVRVDKVEVARSADFASAKLELRREWALDQRRIASEAALQQLRAHWQVERK